MKSFRDYLSEEVVPAALVKDGSIDLDKEEVRASINMALAKVTSDSAITPYIALNRISKALSMFHIILPKRVYLEGAKGVEVHELRQFGHKMGMNDQGEFINEVPGKYFLFIQYGMNTPINNGGQLAYPTMGGTFRVTARVVDPIELNRLLDVAEITVAEECNAETQQLKAKMLAPKEPMKDLDVDGSPSTDADVAVSQRKKDKKLSAGSLDEGYASIGHSFDWAGDVNRKARFYGKNPKATITKNDEKDDTYKDSKQGGKVKFAKTVKEGRMPASVIKHKQKLAAMTPEEKAKRFAGKSEEQLKSMARRHGYGKDSNEYSKHVSKKLDEKTLTPAETRKKEEIVKSMKKGLEGFKERYGKRAKEVMYATATKRAKQVAEKLEFDPSTEIPKNS